MWMFSCRVYTCQKFLHRTRAQPTRRRELFNLKNKKSARFHDWNRRNCQPFFIPRPESVSGRGVRNQAGYTAPDAPRTCLRKSVTDGRTDTPYRDATTHQKRTLMFHVPSRWHNPTSCLHGLMDKALGSNIKGSGVRAGQLHAGKWGELEAGTTGSKNFAWHIVYVRTTFPHYNYHYHSMMMRTFLFWWLACRV